MSDGDDPQAARPGRPPLKQRLSVLFSEYGRIAVITYLVISVLAIVGFSIAIGIGVSPSSATGVLGVIAAGWVAAKATMPIRILITLGLTPVIGLIVRPRGSEAAVALSEAAGEPAPADEPTPPPGPAGDVGPR